MKYLIGGLVGVATASIVWYILWMMHTNKMKKQQEEHKKEIDRLKALIPTTPTPTPTPTPSAGTVVLPTPSGSTASGGTTPTSGTTAGRMIMSY